MTRKHKDKSFFEKAYAIKGDGVALLRPHRLKQIEEYRQSMREMRKRRILDSQDDA